MSYHIASFSWQGCLDQIRFYKFVSYKKSRINFFSLFIKNAVEEIPILKGLSSKICPIISLTFSLFLVHLSFTLNCLLLCLKVQMT